MTKPTVVITGASAGIGEALGKLLTSRGHAVALVARRADVLTQVAAACGPLAHPITADVSSRAEVQRVVREATAALGRIDVWVNNVGQGITRQPSELSDEDVEEMVRLNI